MHNLQSNNIHKMFKKYHFVQKTISIDAAKSEAKSWTLFSSKMEQEKLCAEGNKN